MSITELRPYQIDAANEIRDLYKKNVKKVLLHLATGGGKTVIFSYILRSVVAKNKRAIMVVRGRKLVDQASARLSREQTQHGVLMAGHWNYQPNAPIQICSIDTLISRGLRPEADLIVIDEAHLALSPGYIKFLSQYPEAFILAVTATPYTNKPLRHIASEIVHPISIKELIKQGYLVDARHFCPSSPDLSGVSISKGEYNQTELEEVMQNNALVGDIVKHWQEIAENRSTICFATSVAHSQMIVERFNFYGIKAEHCEANTPDSERNAMLERLENGKTKIISNVGILCTGVDIPHLGCIIMARPTRSKNLYLQQVGRGTRPFHGKSDFILLDHAGNVLRHKFFTKESKANLDGKDTSSKESIRTCKMCFAAFIGFTCPHGCKPEPDEKQNDKTREILEIDGKLKEISEMPFEAKIMQEIEALKAIRKEKGYKRGWVYYKILNKYGVEIAKRFFKQRTKPAWL